jgi:hypothetical protein
MAPDQAAARTDNCGTYGRAIDLRIKPAAIGHVPLPKLAPNTWMTGSWTSKSVGWASQAP